MKQAAFTLPLLLVFLQSFADVGRGAEIRLRATTQVNSAIIRLGDVADVLGDESERERLEAVELAVAPAKGASRAFTRQRVRELLVLRGVDLLRNPMGGSSRVTVLGPERSNAGRPVEVSGSTSAALRQASSDSLEQADEAPKPPMVVVAARPLRRGDRVQRDDVQLQSPSGRLPNGVLTSLEDVVGMELMRAVTTDRPIHDRDVRRPILVKRQDVVSVFARVGSIVLRKNMKALDSGSLHDVVTVEDLQTRQRVSARVVGVQEVEVFAGGGSSATQGASGAEDADSDRPRRMVRPVGRSTFAQ